MKRCCQRYQDLRDALTELYSAVENAGPQEQAHVDKLREFIDDADNSHMEPR